MALHYTRLYITLPRLYFTLLDSALLYHGYTSLYYTLHYSTKVLLHSTIVSILVYHGSTSLY